MNDLPVHRRWPRPNVPAGALRRLAAAAAALLTISCASPRPPRLHTLMPAAEELAAAPARGDATPRPAPAVLLEAVQVPVEVDRPQWLVHVADDSLALLEQERWAAPLPDEIRQALAEILRRRYGAEDVRVAGAGKSPWRVRVNVTRFESSAQVARLEATWSLTGSAPSAPTQRCHAMLVEPVAGDPITGLAAAHRRELLRLGDAIGQTLLSLSRGEQASCPT